MFYLPSLRVRVLRAAPALLVFVGIRVSMPAQVTSPTDAVTHTLTVVIDPVAGGTVTRTPDKTAYNHGETVVLEAQPAHGYVFSRWTMAPAAGGALTNTTATAVAGNPLTLVMAGNIALVAHFASGTASPEIDVQGRGVSIASGDTTASAADDTEFGTVPAVSSATPGGIAADLAAEIESADATGAAGANTLPRVKHRFVVRNLGTAPLNLTGTPLIAKSGANAADFIVAPPAVAALAPGQVVPFDVTFAPTATGSRTATLSIASNDSDENPYTFTLHGTGGAALVPIVPTAEQTTITPAAGAADFRAKVEIRFNSGGYSAAWGAAAIQGNTITLNAAVFQPPAGSAVAAVVTSLVHDYVLGPLAAGEYKLVLRVGDQSVKTGSLVVRTLALAVNPAGSGRIVPTPVPVGGNRYLAGTVVSLLASPGAHADPAALDAVAAQLLAADGTASGAAAALAVFKNWSGDASGTANPVSVTLDANKSVTANFASTSTLPTVSTGAISQITPTSATVEGKVESIGASAVTERGFYLQGLPTTSATAAVKLVEGSGAGGFSRTLTGLNPGAVYTVRAFATNGSGTAFGQMKTFNTPPAAISVTPPGQAVRLGATVACSVPATSDALVPATATYQWKKDGTVLVNGDRISGATTRVLLLANVRFTDAGEYVLVTTVDGTSTPSRGLTLAIVDARHAMMPSPLASASPVANPNVTVTNVLAYAGRPTALGWSAVLPEGSKYVASGGAPADASPEAGATGLLEWTWQAVPASPVTFTYTVTMPPPTATTTAPTTLGKDKGVHAMSVVHLASGPSNILVLPDPLMLQRPPNLHSADSDGDHRFSLVELTRVIELFNTRNGSSRTGSYTPADGVSEDGFAPAPDRTTAAVVTLDHYYSADSNHDGKISLVELTRVIELYNFRSGTARTGEYHEQADSEDGFAPGP